MESFKEKGFLTNREFVEILESKYGEVYPVCWQNYPHSIFYYTKPNPDGGEDNVGIYTNGLTYGIGPC